MPTVSDDAFDLDMAAAALRANGSDVQAMLRALVTQLDDTLGDRLVVERAGGLLRKSHDIKSLQVSLGGDTLRADVDGGSVLCTVGHSSGGIRIRNEQVSMDEWITRLLKALAAEAAHSEAARQALERVVLGGSG
jgi:hypothetical protein